MAPVLLDGLGALEVVVESMLEVVVELMLVVLEFEIGPTSWD